MEKETRWILVKIEPVIIDMTGSIVIYTDKDTNPKLYEISKRLIEKYNLQIGDDLKVCLLRASQGIEPIRPEQTEEQKQIKERGAFST